MKKLGKLIFILAGALALLTIVNATLLLRATTTLDGRIAAIIEAKRPANLELTFLLSSGCKECADISDYVSSMNDAPVNITKASQVYLGSAQAAGLPQVSRLPAVILSGETNKTAALSKLLSGMGFRQVGKYLVLETPYAPYFDIKAGAVRGLATAVAIGAPLSCAGCQSPETLLSDFGLAGLYLASSSTVASDSAQAAALISTHSITALPAVVLSSETSEYRELISQYSIRPSGESYVYERKTPPYFDVSQNRTRGTVSITFLNDSSCATCFDVTYNLLILAGYGVVPASKTYLDVSSAEGASLVSKYNITKAPTFILTGEPQIYPGLAGVWTQVGTTEADGTTMVFREPGVLGAYRDLPTGAVVAPAGGYGG